MSKLESVHPLGLNDKVSGMGLHGNLSDSQFVDYNMYNIVNKCMSRRSGRRSGRHLKKRRLTITDEHLRVFRDDILLLFETGDLSVIGNRIHSTRRKFLERFVRCPYFSGLDSRVRYLITSKVNFSRKMGPVKREKEHITWNANFAHKIIGDVNLNSIIGSGTVRNLLPYNIRNKFDIRMFYNFGKSIGSKILNYNKVLRGTGLLNYNDILNMQCSCASSSFIHDRLGHVITGDLSIIQNPALREVCSYGTKFRENPFLDVDKIKDQVKKDIDNLVIKITNKFRISRNALKDWKVCLFKNFVLKLLACRNNNIYRKPTLASHLCKRELSRLQEEFVITVVDKAAGNFAFTCKKFYFLRLAEELGLNNTNPGNNTYEFIPESESDVINKIKSDLLQFRITPNNREDKLALLYQTPKFHKNPPKLRYIAGNVSTITSKLDSVVANVLKMCKLHFKNLCNRALSFSGIRYYFDVQTSTEVKSMFDEAQGSANSISINDFSTLYTVFDHSHLINNMNWLLSRLSKNSGMSLVRVSHEKAWWVTNSSEGLVYSVGDLIDMIDYLVRNTHVKAFGHIFKQTKGVIMGGKSSGWLSDCSLMVDEYKYIDSKVKSGLISDASKLKFFRRYRDDCTSLNIDDFMTISRDMYPPSLELTKENDRPDGANVLDMVVELSEGNIVTKVYCKTDDFPFQVISLPYLESNLDEKICYKVFYGQTLRFQRLCNLISDFEGRTKMLLDILVNRGYRIGKLRREFCKVVEKYISEFHKWVLPSNFKSWFSDINLGNLSANHPSQISSQEV